LKIKLFRPFPYEKVAQVLEYKKNIAVLDRSESFGADAPLYSEIKCALYSARGHPQIYSCIFGLGGRDIHEKEIENIFSKLAEGELSSYKII